MKIYSWNVYCFNRQIPKVVRYIRELDFDVLCLQEVTPELLEHLREMPFYLACHIDVIRLFGPGRREINYVVILSKQPALKEGTLQFFNFPFPFHTRVFIAYMSLLKWSFVTDRGALYIDLPFNNRTVRIFCVHLTLWGPTNRAKEFDEVVKNMEPGMATIVAGDLNVVEYGPMKVINWLLGAPLKEGLPWYPERDLFEERFAQIGLNNPLRGKITHTFSRSQLDHILVSKELKVTGAEVHKEKNGSDHQPVSVTLTGDQ